MHKGISEQGMKRIAQVADKPFRSPPMEIGVSMDEIDAAIDKAAELLTEASNVLWPYRESMSGAAGVEYDQPLSNFIQELDDLAVEVYDYSYRGGPAVGEQ